MNKKKHIIIGTLIFLTYSIIFLIISIKNQNQEYIYYNLLFYLPMTLLFYIYYRYNLNTYAFYSAVALLGIHLAGGNIMTPEIYLYQIKIINLPFDKIVHVFGSFALTWLIASLVQNVLKPKTKKG